MRRGVVPFKAHSTTEAVYATGYSGRHLLKQEHFNYSPTLYSQISVNTDCQTIRYQVISSSSIFLLLKWSDNKSTLHKQQQDANVIHNNDVYKKWLLYSRYIDHFAPCVFFCLAMSAYTNLQLTHCYFHVYARKCDGCNQRFSGCSRQIV